MLDIDFVCDLIATEKARENPDMEAVHEWVKAIQRDEAMDSWIKEVRPGVDLSVAQIDPLFVHDGHHEEKIDALLEVLDERKGENR